jgi:thioredoxin 1/putative thioredoxin
MPVPEISEQDFETAVLTSELPVLVEFFLPLSNNSKLVAPEVEAAAKELEGKAVVVKMNVDKSPRIAGALRLTAIPTFVVFARGRPVAIKATPLKSKALVQLIEPFLPREEGAMMPVEAAEALKDEGVYAIDIREATSFSRAHIPNAKSFPLETIRERLAELHMLQAAYLIFYCRTGKDSKALALEIANDFPGVGYLEGGFLAWEAEQLPIERPD